MLFKSENCLKLHRKQKVIQWEDGIKAGLYIIEYNNFRRVQMVVLRKAQ
jgi:hypothetical protein